MNVVLNAGNHGRLTWFKSSYSSSDVNSDCVEIAAALRAVHVRDSKDVAGARLRFEMGAWAEFVAYTADR